jgi:uncharacterized protein
MRTPIHLLVLLAFTAGAAVRGAAAQPTAGAPAAAPIPVFDVGLQAHDPAGGFDFASVLDRSNFGMHTPARYGEAVPDADELQRRTLAEMDRSGVRMGLLGHGALTRQWQAAHPERFLLSYEPNFRLEDHTAAVAEFAAGVRDGTFRALGELGLVYGGIPFNASFLLPYYEVAQEHGIPVFIHTGFSGPNPQQLISPAFRIGVADPLLLEDVLIRFPDMKVVMMHMGWPFFDHALYMLATYPNVHMETSVAVWNLGPALFHRMLREAVATVGSDRILFGSLQMVWPEVIGRSVSAVREAEYLTDEDRHNILWRNAARLLRLGEEEIARYHGR